VFGLQSVPGCEIPLGVQNELGKPTLGESLDDTHAETRRSAVERIERYESFEGLRRVVVAQLFQVVVAKIVVNAILVGAIPEFGVVLPNDIRPAEVAETQADDAIGIGDAAVVLLVVSLIEVITDRNLVVEQRHVLLQGLLVQLLLVERPPELVESELVIRRFFAQVDDPGIGGLSVAIFSAREEVLTPPELRLVEVHGMR